MICKLISSLFFGAYAWQPAKYWQSSQLVLNMVARLFSFCYSKTCFKTLVLICRQYTWDTATAHVNIYRQIMRSRAEASRRLSAIVGDEKSRLFVTIPYLQMEWLKIAQIRIAIRANLVRSISDAPGTHRNRSPKVVDYVADIDRRDMRTRL